MKKATVLTILSGLFLSTIIGCSKKPDTTCAQYALYIPDSFTPIGNGLDNVFEPKPGGYYITNYQMLIFDNAGDQIFKTTDLSKGWNGEVEGDTIICPEGTYIYQIKATDACGNQHLYTGNVSLLK